MIVSVRFFLSMARAGLCLLVMVQSGAAQDFETLQDQAGRSIQAHVEALIDGQVHLVRADGHRFVASLEIFSRTDQERLRKRFLEANSRLHEEPGASAAASLRESMNAAVGFPLFPAGALWEAEASGVAHALDLREESRTAYEASYRRYPREATRLFGARPYSVALYARDGRPQNISIVYMNRGDLPLALAEASETSIRTEAALLAWLRSANQRDAGAITQALENVLGEGRFFATGQGTFRETTTRWDWEGHAFLLVSEPTSHTALSILPSAEADARGRAQWSPAPPLRERMRADLLLNDFGDVLIGNLPMVDQGPKGYCVPATFERVMRYVDIPADMYRLAQAGGSGIGGGTSMERMLGAVEDHVRRHGRQFTTMQIGSSMHALTRQIDEGVPLLWLMYSGAEYNRLADRHTRERLRATDPRAWSASLDERRRAARSLPINRGAPHICLIIGYNEITGEVAVSDSWGPNYALRWILFEEMQQVSMRNTAYLIRP
ncbi:MAG: hypothetical protein JJT96_15230 [Opitutales bacterium]|nr:hypothetical protein [Opitutales bacterium]